MQHQVAVVADVFKRPRGVVVVAGRVVLGEQEVPLPLGRAGVVAMVLLAEQDFRAPLVISDSHVAEEMPQG